MPWIFGLFLVTPCALTSCHIVISKQDSTIRSLGFNRCVTGRSLREGATWSDLERVQRIAVEQGTCSRSEVSRLARGCKCLHSLAPGRRYGKKSFLWIYVSPTISQLTTNDGPLLKIKLERYFYKKVFLSYLYCYYWDQQIDIQHMVVDYSYREYMRDFI